ncbi:MAG TPA: malto-oligosyltrehalose trehalohydrolase [Terracidiphilus sp.]|jgi:maltooligosyltrehalose trehalohydrolase|nr:malto-oligosyltrehalose trehalohydrolase [Terracidiphilus sp.]
MHRFEIWAPLAKQMAVQIDGAAFPMQGPDESGFWRIALQAAGPGTDYGYLVDSEATPYPDPRSQWQPNGVHGLSRVYDQNVFAWSDAQFQPLPLASAVLYELHPGTFTEAGTLDAAIEKLDYLADLGITHVELMPVASFAGEHGWGYDGVALFAVHEPYGGPDALKRFVDAAHARGLAVLLDVVYNHFGPVGNYTGKFGSYITDAHHTPWGGAVNLEESGSCAVRRFFCDNALMWMRDFHIDGLRLDAVHALVDRSAIHFLEQLAIETEALSASVGRRLVLIAESDLNDPRIVTPREANGFGLTAQWSDDFHHALFAALTDQTEGYYADFGSLEQLAKALEQTFVFDGVYSRYRKRMHGRPTGALSQHRFLGYIQNHDQVGNRAIGDRIEQIAGLDRAKIAAALVLMSPFIPMIFQGEEWAASSPFQYFADHDDPELARLVSEGRKREFSAFGWKPDSIPDPESRETFERSKLNWRENSQAAHAEMLNWYRKLIHFRRSTPSLNDGEPGHTRVAYDEAERWLRMQRGAVSVFCNLGGSARSFHVPEGSGLAIASREEAKMEGGVLTLPPDAIAAVSMLENSQ